VLAVLAAVGFVVYYGTAQRLTASLDASLRTATAQAMAGTNNQNGHLTLGPQLDEGLGSDDLRASGLSLAVFGQSGEVLRQYGPYDATAAPGAALAAAQRGVTTTESRADPRSGVRVRVRATPLSENDTTLAVFSVALSEKPMLDTLRQLRLTLLVLLPLAAAVAALLGYLLTRRMLRPLARMQATAAEISSHDLSRRLGVAAGGDEVSQLAATFDAMLDRLEASFVRGRQFVVDASHELRTPLAAIQAIVSVMRQRRRSVPDYERALDDVSLETARLRALVESLLQLARSDGSDDLDMQDLDLSQLLGDVCASLAPLAESKGLTLRTDVPPGLVSHADADALIRLFVNVIDNAVKYTERGEIAVAARRTGKGLEVTVRDTGPGIPAAHLPHLFDRFFRGDASRSSEGSGLGLPIAQELAAVHGGTIVVASEERVGTICTVTLPGLAGNSRRWSARLQAT